MVVKQKLHFFFNFQQINAIILSLFLETAGKVKAVRIQELLRKLNDVEQIAWYRKVYDEKSHAELSSTAATDVYW